MEVEREAVDGTCGACGARTLSRYPVVGEEGWVMVVKCQTCLVDAERQPWRRLGPIELLIDSLEGAG